MRFVSDTELATLTPAEVRDTASPIPTQVVSNGEFTPLPQSEDQKRVEARIDALATELAPAHGLNRRAFLSSAAGIPGVQRSVLSGVHRKPRGSRHARRRGCARPHAPAPVHRRLPDALRAR